MINSETKKLLDFIPLRDKSIVLDLGCGTAEICEYLATKNLSLLGIDINLPLKDEEIIRVSDQRISYFLMKADIINLDFNGKVKHVLMLGLLHYFDDFQTIKKLLKKYTSKIEPDGLLILSFIDDSLPYHDGRKYLPNTNQVIELLKTLNFELSYFKKIEGHDVDIQKGAHVHSLSYIVFHILK